MSCGSTPFANPAPNAFVQASLHEKPVANTKPGSGATRPRAFSSALKSSSIHPRQDGPRSAGPGRFGKGLYRCRGSSGFTRARGRRGRLQRRSQASRAGSWQRPQIEGRPCSLESVGRSPAVRTPGPCRQGSPRHADRSRSMPGKRVGEYGGV